MFERSFGILICERSLGLLSVERVRHCATLDDKMTEMRRRSSQTTGMHFTRLNIMFCIALGRTHVIPRVNAISIFIVCGKRQFCIFIFLADETWTVTMELAKFR